MDRNEFIRTLASKTVFERVRAGTLRAERVDELSEQIKKRAGALLDQFWQRRDVEQAIYNDFGQKPGCTHPDGFRCHDCGETVPSIDMTPAHRATLRNWAQAERNLATKLRARAVAAEFHAFDLDREAASNE